MLRSTAEKEANELVAEVKTSLEKLRKAIIKGEDASFVGLFYFANDGLVETHNAGEGDDLLLMALSEIEGLAVNFADDGEGRAAVIDIALQYLSDLKASFLDGSFDSLAAKDCKLFDEQTMIDGGEQ